MPHHRKAWLSLLPVVCVLLSRPAAALPDPHAVLEFFVSQSCSACRPATELAAELNKDPGLIVLSLPVNYWDYLGWKDTLADPQFTKRQKGYALIRKNRQVYTPQTIVNGIQSCLGSARDKVARAIERASAGRTPLPVAMDVREENGMVIVDVGSGAGEATVWLLPVRRRSHVQIHDGENAGRMETYVNVVRGLHPLGSWSGPPVRFATPREAVEKLDADAYVALLQKTEDGKPSMILGASKGPGW